MWGGGSAQGVRLGFRPELAITENVVHVDTERCHARRGQALEAYGVGRCVLEMTDLRRTTPRSPRRRRAFAARSWLGCSSRNVDVSTHIDDMATRVTGRGKRRQPGRLPCLPALDVTPFVGTVTQRCPCSRRPRLQRESSIVLTPRDADGCVDLDIGRPAVPIP